MKNFEDKVAAITGSGMGRCLAVELASQDCHLALSDVNEAGLTGTAALVSGGKVTTTRVDVADRAQVETWAQQVMVDHGRFNLIFNNAGVALVSTVEGMSYEDCEWLMDINFWGVVYGTKAFLPPLKTSGEGHIINTSSVFGLAGIPSQSAYNAAKFTVRGFTESLRQELDMQHSPVSATSVHPCKRVEPAGCFGALEGDGPGLADAHGRDPFEGGLTTVETSEREREDGGSAALSCRAEDVGSDPLHGIP